MCLFIQSYKHNVCRLKSDICWRSLLLLLLLILDIIIKHEFSTFQLYGSLGFIKTASEHRKRHDDKITREPTTFTSPRNWTGGRNVMLDPLMEVYCFNKRVLPILNVI